MQCNYCSYQDMKERAKENYEKIVLKPSIFIVGWVDVFRAKRGEKIPFEDMIPPNKKLPNGNEIYERYCTAHFAGLGNECAC